MVNFEQAKKLIAKKILSLPREKQLPLLKHPWMDEIMLLGSKFGLTQEQKEKLAIETMLVLVELTDERYLSSEITDRVNISQDMTKEIISDIRKNIFAYARPMKSLATKEITPSDISLSTLTPELSSQESLISETVEAPQTKTNESIPTETAQALPQEVILDKTLSQEIPAIESAQPIEVVSEVSQNEELENIYSVPKNTSDIPPIEIPFVNPESNENTIINEEQQETSTISELDSPIHSQTPETTSTSSDVLAVDSDAMNSISNNEVSDLSSEEDVLPASQEPTVEATDTDTVVTNTNTPAIETSSNQIEPTEGQMFVENSQNTPIQSPYTPSLDDEYTLENLDKIYEEIAQEKLENSPQPLNQVPTEASKDIEETLPNSSLATETQAQQEIIPSSDGVVESPEVTPTIITATEIHTTPIEEKVSEIPFIREPKVVAKLTPTQGKIDKKPLTKESGDPYQMELSDEDLLLTNSLRSNTTNETIARHPRGTSVLELRQEQKTTTTNTKRSLTPSTISSKDSSAGSYTKDLTL